MTALPERPSLLTRLFLHSLRRAEKRVQKGRSPHEIPLPLPGHAPAPHPRTLARLRKIAGRPSFPTILSSLQIRTWRPILVPGGEGRRPARLYRPRGTVHGAILFLHGGGFVHCDLVSHHGICCRLARQSGAMVLSLDYRLAPEHKFPAAVDDAWAALQWLAQQMEGRGPVAVAGDSAGGNLAAVIALKARDTGGPKIAAQLLIYPVICGADAPDTRTRYARGYFLTESGIAWYGAQYLSHEAELRDPRFAPVLASSFAGLPPAAIITGGFDPLRGDGERYRDLLQAAGVPVFYRCYGRMIHGFLNFYALLADGRSAIRVGAHFLRRHLRAPITSSESS
jgi:acetyl esterase